jgi:hypothetical protein
MIKGGTCSMVLENNSYVILVGESDGMRSRGILTCKLEDNIKMDFKVIYGGIMKMDSSMRAEVLTTVSVDVPVCSSVTPYSPGVHKLSKKSGSNLKILGKSWRYTHNY